MGPAHLLPALGEAELLEHAEGSLGQRQLLVVRMLPEQRVQPRCLGTSVGCGWLGEPDVCRDWDQQHRPWGGDCG